MWFWSGNDDQAERWFRRGGQIGRRAELPEIEALALTGSARVALRTDVQRAHRLAAQAWRMSDPNDDTVARSSAAHVLGVAAQMAGDLHAAREWMLQRMAMAREEGNFLQLGAEAGNLSMVERRLGALLLGAAEAMLAAQRVAWPPDERQEYDATLSRLTERLSADELSTARETGGAMDLDDLLRLALDSP